MPIGRSIQRAQHVPQPGVALRRADDEGGVTHAQPRVSALLAVGARAAPVLHQEQREVARRLGQVIGVEGAQQGVAGDTDVEEVHQVHEELVPPDPVVEAVHGVESIGRRMLPIRGRSSMVEPQPSKLMMPVRSWSAALLVGAGHGFIV